MEYNKKRIIIIILYILALLGVGIQVLRAQTYTFNHDPAVMNQFMMTEGLGGVAVPDIYYDTFHSGYRQWAMLQGKSELRMAELLEIVTQPKMAEDVDSALSRRNKIEILNIADRMTDVAWQTEGKKLESLYDEDAELIRHLSKYGASLKVREAYERRLVAIDFSIRETRDAYMPNGKRKDSFLADYDALVSLRRDLRDLLIYYKSLKDIKGAKKARSIRSTMKDVIQREHLAWQERQRKFNKTAIKTTN